MFNMTRKAGRTQKKKTNNNNNSHGRRKKEELGGRQEISPQHNLNKWQEKHVGFESENTARSAGEEKVNI